MKIIVEGFPLFGKRTGVGQYLKNLLNAALKHDSVNQYIVFGFLFMGRKVPWKDLPTAPNAKYKYVRFMPGRLYNRLRKIGFGLPIDALLRERADVFLFTNFKKLPQVFKDKSIVIIYDISFLTHGHFSEERNRQDLIRNVPKAANEANHIITISQNAKLELKQYFNIDPNKIEIINPAVDHGFFKPQAAKVVNKIKLKYGIRGNYILYTGTLEPRKNIVGILNAYASLEKKLQENCTLVLAGGKGWQDESIYGRLAELKDLPILTTGYVPDEDLPALYSGASVFVYPSHYEGFGMPPLEAMACGVPVITSDNSSLPEVVGDAGIMIKADDTDALAKNIKKVLTDDKLAQKMRASGLQQAQKFNWDESGKKLVELLEKIGRS
jgi:glycosyltransferase involved in cell wall biosynthesis